MRPIHRQLQALWPMVVTITEEWQKRILPNLNGEHMVLAQSDGLGSLLPFPEVALISGISNPEELGAGTISIADAVGSMLGTLGVSTPLSPSLHQTPRWNWLGNSKTQWQSFVEADKRPLDQAERLLGFEEAKGPLASAAMIDFGRLSRLENLWIAGVLDQAPVDTEGNLSIPTMASGRRLSITPAEVKEFLACMEALGRLTSFSKSDDQGRALSRSRYDWKAR